MKKELIPLIERRDSLEYSNQILTVAGVTLSLFASGNILGFSAVTIPSLLSKESEIETDAENMSWMASLVTIGCIVGTLIGGLMSDAIGRKKTILFASVIYSIGWIIIAQATDVADLLTGRMLTGIASGFSASTVQVYICEIVEPKLRGVCGSLPTLMVSIGILSIYCMGSVMLWRGVALLCSIFPLFVLTYVVFLPESPVWLISKGHQPEALKSLTWLRNDPEGAEQECMRLQYLNQRRVSRSFSIRNCCSRMGESSVLKPLFISMALFAFQQFSGVYPIIFYATSIFKYADHFINDYLETVIVGFIRMFATLGALFLVNFFKRRTLLIISGILMSLSTGILGGYFYLRETEGDMGNSTMSHPQIPIPMDYMNIEWVPLTMLGIFMLSYSCGFGIIPWFLVAELMPSDVRSLSCSLAFAFNQLCLFTAVKTFLEMVEALDAFGTFWFYSVTSFVGVIFVIVFVPETSNLNSGEIEEIFEYKYNTTVGDGKRRNTIVEDSDF